MKIKINNKNLKTKQETTICFLKSYIAKYKNGFFMTSAFGANGIVLLDNIKKLLPQIPVYFINTGCHFEQTLELKEKYKKMGINVKEVFPRIRNLKLYKISTNLCCWINKVEPMKRILNKKENRIWLTGLSRSQSKTRSKTKAIEKLENDKIKINPLILWTKKDIWQYIKENKLPYNPLYDRRYKSIGCSPCTTQVQDNEDERAGRWRNSQKTECGLHTHFKLNMKK